MDDVTGFDAGWSEHPDAIDGPAERPLADGGVRPVPLRVVGIGAICELRTPGSAEAHSQSFSVSEYADLENGQRVILHNDRGFTIGSSAGAIRRYETPASITQTVLNVVLPDDDNSADSHPWSWLAELARAHGLNVTAEGLENLPYEVALRESVTEWLADP